YLAGLALVLTGIVWLTSRGFGASAPKSTSGYHPGEISANGLVEGKTPEVALRAEMVGTIRVIAFREGPRVRKGDPLVSLVNDTQQQQVGVAKAETDAAQAELDRVRNGEREEKRKSLAAIAAAKKATFEQAEKLFVRAQKLLKTTAVSREE